MSKRQLKDTWYKPLQTFIKPSLSLTKMPDFHLSDSPYRMDIKRVKFYDSEESQIVMGIRWYPIANIGPEQRASYMCSKIAEMFS
jgi:hypothetical protein